MTTVIALLAVIGASCGVDDSAGTADPPTEPPPTEPPTTEPPPTEPPTTEPPPIEPPPIEPQPVQRPVEFELPTDPDAVVLRVDVGVNEPDPFAIASSLPPLTLYADGRVVIVSEQGTPGELAVVEQARVSPDVVRVMVERAIESGALRPSPPPPIVEADDGYEIADVDGRWYEIAVASSNQEFDELSGSGPKVTSVERIIKSWELAGEGPAEDLAPYRHERVLLLDPEGNLPVGAEERIESYESRSADIWCVELTGTDAAEAVAAAQDPDSSFIGYGWLELRPVLPDEPGCDVVSDR